MSRRSNGAGCAVTGLGCLSLMIYLAFVGLALVALALGVYWLWGQVV